MRGKTYPKVYSKMKTKRITVEEHYVTPEYLDLLKSIMDGSYPSAEVVREERCIGNDAPFIPILKKDHVREMVNKLMDIGQGRLTDMDQGGIDMQVLSFVSPGVQVFEPKTAIKMAREMNDQLSRLVHENPARFAGLAALPMQSPEAAADELERSASELGMVGACIFSHTRGEYPDDKKFRCVFERANELNMPMYLHPRAPSPQTIKPYQDYPFFDCAMWGYAAETGLSAMRMICSGIFSEYPGLKIVLGHLGEAIPFWLWRIDNYWKMGGYQQRFGKKASEFFKDNFMVSTSGMFSELALKYTISALGADNVMFAIDYPMEAIEEGVEFMENADIDPRDREKIYYLNAEKLFFKTTPFQ